MGGTIIDTECETSMGDTFAADDCTTAPYRQIVIVTDEGAKAPLSSFDYLIRAIVAQKR